VIWYLRAGLSTTGLFANALIVPKNAVIDVALEQLQFCERAE
jgi:hypothetical protein